MPRRKKHHAYIVDEDGKHRPGSSSTSAAERNNEESDSQSSTGPSRKPRDVGKSSSKQRRQPNPSPAKGKAPAGYRRTHEKSASFKIDSKRDGSPGIGPSRGPRLYHRPYNSKPDRNSYNDYSNDYPSYYSRQSAREFPAPSMVPYGYSPYNAGFTPASAPAGGPSYFGEPLPAYMAQYHYSAPPPPAEEVAPEKTPAPAPPPEKTKEQKEGNEAIDKLKQEIDNLKEEYKAKELQKEQQREFEQKIRQEAELAAMEKVRAEEQKRLEIERVKQEAERKAREEAEAEKRAHEERQRLYEEAIERVQKETHERLKKEHEEELERKKREAEESQRLMREAEARLIEQLEEHRRRQEKEEENQRLLREKEAKLAQELEDHRKRREQEEEEKRQMFQKLKDEIRAEFMEGDSRYMSSSHSGSRSMRSYRTTATSQSSVIDPFDFYDGQSTPGFDQPQKPSKRQDAYWTWDRTPADWSYQVYVSNARDQNFGHVHPGMLSAYEYQGWRPRTEYSERGTSRGSRVGHDVRRSHYQSSNAQPRFPKVSADDEDSDNGTVIPSSSQKTRSQPTEDNDASHARGGPFQLNQLSGNQPLDIQVGLATIDIPNGNSASLMQNQPSPKGSGDRLNEPTSQVDTPWAIAPLENENKGKGKEVETDHTPGTSREKMPDPDGGVDLTSSNLTNLPVPQPSPRKILPENPGDDTSRDSPKAAQRDQPVRPSPVPRQATRDSPLLPLLAKHVSDFERSTQQKRPSDLRRQAPSSTSTDTKDDYQYPYPPDAAAWPSWSNNDVPANLFPYYMGRQENWPAYGPPSRRMDDSKSDASDYTYEPETPMALVPCIMLPLHMVQPPMRGPVIYPGMMQPRRSRRRQPSNLQSEYAP